MSLPLVAAEAKKRLAGSGFPPTALAQAIQLSAGPTPYHDIILLADILDDFMRVRIANQNRLRSLTSTEDWGKGVPAPEYIGNLIGHLEALEHGAELHLIRAVRRSPLGAWVKATSGVGEKGIGRLLKEIGDPAWNFKEDRPRTLRELYAYCGLHVWPVHGSSDSHNGLGGPGTDPQTTSASHTRSGVGAISEGGDAQGSSDSQAPHGVAPYRVKGQQSNWSTAAKTRLYTTAEACMKHRGSVYRPVYDAARLKYADRVHEVECRRCGPAGKPALVGSALNLGHQHARALRLVMKAILKDLWQAARNVHFPVDSQRQSGVAELASACPMPGHQTTHRGRRDERRRKEQEAG